jgi:hypothetical protein
MEEEEGTPMEKEGDPKTPSQSASKEWEDAKNMDKKCCGSNNWVTIELWHQEECKSPSYVHDHTYKWGLLEKL